jgi:hypothetical protein
MRLSERQITMLSWLKEYGTVYIGFVNKRVAEALIKKGLVEMTRTHYIKLSKKGEQYKHQ